MVSSAISLLRASASTSSGQDVQLPLVPLATASSCLSTSFRLPAIAGWAENCMRVKQQHQTGCWSHMASSPFQITVFWGRSGGNRDYFPGFVGLNRSAFSALQFSARSARMVALHHQRLIYSLSLWDRRCCRWGPACCFPDGLVQTVTNSAQYRSTVTSIASSRLCTAELHSLGAS
jgi:hypothetical protein